MSDLTDLITAVENLSDEVTTLTGTVDFRKSELDSAVTTTEGFKNDSENARNESETFRNQTRDAAEASGDVRFFDTFAEADAATLDEDQVVEVFEDETRGGARTRYRVESGELVFKFAIARDLVIYSESLSALESADPSQIRDGQTAHVTDLGVYVWSDSDQEWKPSADVAFAQRGISLSATAITDVEFDIGGPRPLEIFDEKLWAQDGEDIVSSEDGGQTWDIVAAGPSGQSARGLIPTSDGEVLFQTAQRIYKSDGWPSSPSWSVVFENPTSNVTNIRRWGFDGQGDKFIVTHYVGSFEEWGDSWGVWVSTDAGDNWTLAWDSREEFGEETAAETHIHGVAYDPFADRFWFVEGHIPGISGPYFSDDDGVTWTRLGGELVDPLTAAPTTITAASKGMVLAMDSSEPNGVAVIARTEDPADMGLRMAYRWRQLSGFGDQARRDPRTGIVYIGWRTGDRPRNDPNWSAAEDSNSRPPFITASDGNTADIIYEYQNFDWVRGDKFRAVIPDSYRGVVTGRFELGSNITTFRGRLNEIGALPGTWHDRNTGVFGGFAEHPESIAIGGGSYVPAGRKITAIGPQAYLQGEGQSRSDTVLMGFGSLAKHSRTVVIGSQARADEQEAVVIGAFAEAVERDVVLIGYDAEVLGRWGVAIGHSSEAGERGVAIGSSNTPTVAGNGAVAIGRDTQATISSVAIGRSAITGKNGTEGRQSLALGEGAETEAARYSIAIGNDARTNALNAIAIGRDAQATHSSAIAMGNGVATSSSNQVSVGSKHFEIGNITQPAAPGAGFARLYVTDVGGVQTLRVRFANGNVVDIGDDS